MAYNSYRHRYYNLSKNDKKQYAEEMQKIENYFSNSDWSISKSLDSCYYYVPELNLEIRISNHSAEYQHDLTGETGLIVNIKSSKTNFINIIENEIPIILNYLSQLDLSKYRFINIVGENMNCFFKNFKTKKETFKIKRH